MKAKFILLGLFVLFAQYGFGQSTALTYQGRLMQNGAPANGFYDVRFAVHDAFAGGNLIAPAVTNLATVVSNGLFTVRLDLGQQSFNGGSRWLELAMRTNG